MKRTGLTHIGIIAAALLVPVSAFAVPTPMEEDVPFFGWLAVPVAGVVGHTFLKKK